MSGMNFTFFHSIISTKTTCKLKTEQSSAEGGTFPAVLNIYLKIIVLAHRIRKKLKEESVSALCRLFCYVLWENTGFTAPFGITLVIHNLR
jgi:hypothetical protein